MEFKMKYLLAFLIILTVQILFVAAFAMSGLFYGIEHLLKQFKLNILTDL